eukprot:scaffold28526_cov62-Phaeocystis_antarctica.AAC.1
MAHSASSEHDDGAEPTPNIVTAHKCSNATREAVDASIGHGAQRIERARRQGTVDAEDRVTAISTRAALQREK